VAMLESGDYGRAFLYVGLSVVEALIGAFAGIALARELLAWQRAG
jgi:fluoride ion exporter CrcB/FEX